MGLIIYGGRTFARAPSGGQRHRVCMGSERRPAHRVCVGSESRSAQCLLRGGSLADGATGLAMAAMARAPALQVPRT
jgi:hypothetical protein